MEDKIRQLEIEGEHFVLTKRQNSDLFRILEGRGYPTYRIIDQEGNLVRNAQPRPSDLKFVKQFIDPLLQE
ncbi:MAG: hypothetical protein AAF806_19770 [Bacteroidota bacterium]